MESNCFASGLLTGEGERERERQTDRQTDRQRGGRGTNLNLILPSVEILTERKVVIIHLPLLNYHIGNKTIFHSRK